MLKKIKNTFIKLTTDSVRIIKGSLGYHTNIKDIYVVNNTAETIFLSIYILDANQQKTYLIKDVTIPAKKRFEIPHEGNIELEHKEYIFAETRKETNLDIFCNYIEKEKEINIVELLFKNQEGLNVSGILYSTVVLENGKKIIRFSENTDYSDIPDITYQIVGQKFIVYKTPNLKIPSHNFDEYSDRYEINLYAKKDSITFNDFITKSFLNISSNIIEEVSEWRYNTENIFSGDVLWNSMDSEISLLTGSFYLNFKDITNYITPENLYLTLLADNLVEYNIEYVKNYGTLKVSTVLSNIDNLTWRLVDGFGGEILSQDYYMNSLVELETGTHTIQVDAIDEIIGREYQIFINKNQDHILYHTDYFINPRMSVEINIGEANEIWQINTTDNFENVSSWYDTSGYFAVIDEGTYFINFANVDGYTKPSIQNLILSENTSTILKVNYVNNSGYITITKPSLLDESIAKGIKWRIINKTTQEKSNWFVYDYIHQTNNGEYFIEFQSVEDYFESFISSVLIYKEQKTTYVMNNSILM